jgi:hypothetical protein
LLKSSTVIRAAYQQYLRVKQKGWVDLKNIFSGLFIPYRPFCMPVYYPGRSVLALPAPCFGRQAGGASYTVRQRRTMAAQVDYCPLPAEARRRGRTKTLT